MDETPRRPLIDGHAVRILRVTRGWSAKALTARINSQTGRSLDNGSICRIEKGRRGASPQLTKDIAEALGVTVADILTDSASVGTQSAAPGAGEAISNLRGALPEAASQ